MNRPVVVPLSIAVASVAAMVTASSLMIVTVAVLGPPTLYARLR